MFGERLKALRKARNMTQDELCVKLGVVRKTLSDYENGRRYPKSVEVISKLCEIFNVSKDFLLTDEDMFIQEAKESLGSKGSIKAKRLINETAALFAGGELDDEDKALVFKAVSELYWETRETNKKYTPKKHRND
ncbi:MAG: helix-turn-helix transcriptional regulator [Clostridiaceae bacterium]